MAAPWFPLTLFCLFLFKGLKGLAAHTTEQYENHWGLTPDDGVGCPPQSYQTYLFSHDPLIIYISSFVTTEEIAHLLMLNTTDFRASGILRGDQGGVIDAYVRSSKSVMIERTPIVRCIEDRALAFQGFGTSSNGGSLETLQVVKYDLSEEFKHHFDWSNLAKRATTFFVYLETNCTGGGTNFPRLKAPLEEKWCEFVDCDETFDAGVTFKPIAGNAIFWQNLRPDGEGYQETLHAGLPVTSGHKAGLNIWTNRGDPNTSF